MFIAANPERYLGETVGTGQCVDLVRQATGAPETSVWFYGPTVWGSGDTLPRGCAIATFDLDGQYGNHTDGRSHAALLLELTEAGLVVVDQWKGQPVHQRTIRFKGGQGPPCDDADTYSVIDAIA